MPDDSHHAKTVNTMQSETPEGKRTLGVFAVRITISANSMRVKLHHVIGYSHRIFQCMRWAAGVRDHLFGLWASHWADKPICIRGGKPKLNSRMLLRVYSLASLFHFSPSYLFVNLFFLVRALWMRTQYVNAHSTLLIVYSDFKRFGVCNKV